LGAALTEAGNDVVTALRNWQERQLECGRRLVARAREVGNCLQFKNTWPVGESLPFGLYESGDSAFLSLYQHDGIGARKIARTSGFPLGTVGAAELSKLQEITKEVVGIHVLLTRLLFGDGILRSLLLRVSLAKPTSALLRF
jgi:hypothetical protein